MWVAWAQHRKVGWLLLWRHTICCTQAALLNGMPIPFFLSHSQCGACVLLNHPPMMVHLRDLSHRLPKSHPWPSNLIKLLVIEIPHSFSQKRAPVLSPSVFSEIHLLLSTSVLARFPSSLSNGWLVGWCGGVSLLLPRPPAFLLLDLLALHRIALVTRSLLIVVKRDILVTIQQQQQWLFQVVVVVQWGQ